MKILILGGTRFFGIHMINSLLDSNHDITIATRGITNDDFNDKIKRIIVERTDELSLKNALLHTHYDVVIDKIAYCSNDIRKALDYIDCDKYIYMSSTAIYNPKHINTVETDFNGFSEEVLWCERDSFPYDKIKRHAEYALWQKYSHINWIAVRYPFVIGKDDYTKRLLFYVEHVMKSKPMNIDNLYHQLSFIRSDEAGDFIAYLVDKNFNGPINGASSGTISLKEIIDYVSLKTNKQAVITVDGDNAPYNTEVEYSINTHLANNLGYNFLKLNDYIYDLLDYYIDKIEKEL